MALETASRALNPAISVHFPALHQKICVRGHLAHAQHVNAGNLISTPDSLHG